MSASTRMYFASVNGGHLEEVTAGHRVLLSFAYYLESPALWKRHQPLLEGGQWRSAILDSGAFTELSQRKRGKVFKVPVEAYATFLRDHGHLFEWCCNLDDIEGDVATSNRNFDHLVAAAPGVRLVPVFHEGESREQLEVCIRQAREHGGGLLGLGGQRPKGSLRPTKVVAFLHQVYQWLKELDALDLELHGLGMPRYAAANSGIKGAPAEGFPLASTDSTTWNMEGCKAFNAGATATRRDAHRAAVLSYQARGFALGSEPGPALDVAFDLEAAAAAGGQAAVVARRLAELVEVLELAA
jgi:hypothetical protein